MDQQPKKKEKQEKQYYASNVQNVTMYSAPIVMHFYMKRCTIVLDVCVTDQEQTQKLERL